jgi:protein-L-isoaspartate(D-aspartate) O-methyltransferase
MAMATTSQADASFDRRLHMVNTQLRTGDVVDQEVLAAFLAVARERFVAAGSVPLAYLDRELPALGAKSRRLLTPLTLARLLQAAGPKAGERALDVGCGSGYGAALLDAMGATVTALESDHGAASAARELLAGAEGVTVVEGPLEAGAADRAPFDIIVIEGAFGVRPDALIGQLADGGRLVGIDAIMGAPQGALYERRAGVLSRRALFEAAGDVLDGFQRAASFAF